MMMLMIPRVHAIARIQARLFKSRESRRMAIRFCGAISNWVE
jgi:hypothetical protein